MLNAYGLESGGKLGARAYPIIEKYHTLFRELPFNERTIVEIGSERNEGSTTFLCEFSKLNDYPFFTVDFNVDSYNRVQRICGQSAYNMRGEAFLNSDILSNYKIAFTYLDNFDLITYDGRTWEERKQLYKNYGLELNNHNAKISHLIQSVLINIRRAYRSVILIDDTWINENGDYEGKGGYAVPYLLSCGWKLTNQPKKGYEELDSYVLLESFECSH